MASIVLQAEKPGDRLKEITDKLEQGVKEIFASDKYAEYLNTMSKFHNYSTRNCVLLFMQNPQASYVAGFQAWKNNFSRNVKKGEKSLKIVAPSPYKTTVQKEKIDPATKSQARDANGRPVFESAEITVPAFKVISVFDVSQTEGKELPTITSKLTGNVEQYKDFFAVLEVMSPVPIKFENIPGSTNGYYDLKNKRIAVQEGMSEAQSFKTIIHEIAHAKLHDVDLNAPKDSPNRVDKRTREVEAESVAYAVCQHFGIDTSDYSFGYLAGWSSGKELTELRGSLETIRSTSSTFITILEEGMKELTHQREQLNNTQKAITEILEAPHSLYSKIAAIQDLCDLCKSTVPPGYVHAQPEH